MQHLPTRTPSTRPFTVSCFVATALLFASITVGALPDHSKGILKRADVVAAAAKVTAQRFPNADSVLVDDAIIEQYEPDGTSVSYDDTYFKVLTEKGR
ncbi:MAG: hypothetical protein KAI66_05975, partial [Lentisphaeria bacterium]|nr:hypothetical protein [Lentisphaeria bacterium]